MYSREQKRTMSRHKVSKQRKNNISDPSIHSNKNKKDSIKNTRKYRENKKKNAHHITSHHAPVIHGLVVTLRHNDFGC